MKAVVITEHGELDKVKLADVPKPGPDRGEVLIQVKSAALNHLDIWVRKGKRGVTMIMPHTLGCDASGIVVEAGEDVDKSIIGKEVIINPGLSCRKCEFCARGEQSECVSFGLVGMHRQGTFAQFVTVPAVNVYQKPEYMTFDQAAALPLAYVTAWRMLFSRAQVKAGQTVLIHGIGGGVALAALQLAKIAGAKVIVTSSSEEKLERARYLGADQIINYKTGDAVVIIRDVTKGRGVDIALDTVGAATMPINLGVVRKGGKIVICGVTSGPDAQLNLQSLYWNQLVIMGSTMGSDDDFRSLISAAAAVKLQPVISSVYPLEQAKDALVEMENGRQFGKIVLKIS